MTSSRASLSTSTHALIDLLTRYRRQDIFAVVSTADDPLDMLLSGALEAALGERSKVIETQAYKPASSEVLQAVGYFDAAFPALLKCIPDPPLVLFYRGELSVAEGTCIAVVGARRCTSQGRRHAESLARELALQGIHVASGLALGIDGAAHRGALAANGLGKTVAVLGSGLARIYPSRHADLATGIVAEGGLLLSEYADHVGPHAYRFPERNRIISGLSVATVIVEAGDKSGSLITARLAAEQGRDVLAMPGPVSSLVSAGCHRLIQQGAGLITGVADVLSNVGIAAAPTGDSVDMLDDCQRRVLELMQGYTLTLDELLVKSELQPAQLTRVLVQLEVAGFVEQGALGYIRTS